MQVQVLFPAPRRRKLHLACDDFFVSQTSHRGALFRCDSFPQKVTLGFSAHL
jgi:hypothetical protein